MLSADLSDKYGEVSVEGQVEGHLQSVHLLGPAEVDGPEPVFDSSEALLDHIESQGPSGGVP